MTNENGNAGCVYSVRNMDCHVADCRLADAKKAVIVVKRPNGHGSVYKLSGNRRKPWVAVAHLGWGKNGKAFRYTVGYFSSQDRAHKALEDYNLKRKEKRSYVYFISDGTYTKIGKANDVEKRLKQLQTAHALELKVICKIPFENEPDAFEAEKLFHKLFAKNQAMNEWFLLDEEDHQTLKEGALFGQ